MRNATADSKRARENLPCKYWYTRTRECSENFVSCQQDGSSVHCMLALEITMLSWAGYYKEY